MNQKTQRVFAPAKINLFLHVTGKRKDGYHKLDSLVAFADVGDAVEIEPAESFSFIITGLFASAFHTQSGYLDDKNLVVRAARNLSQIADKALHVKIRLVKNLPLSSGLGGGSSDAAATIWGLQRFWGLQTNHDYVEPLLLKLGADVPVCYRCQPSVMRGIGERITPAPDMPEIPILIVNSGHSCSTADVFAHHNHIFTDLTSLPKRFCTVFDLVDFLSITKNDLYEPALTLIPEIGNVIHALEAQADCLIARMSGSGASCFGLFEHQDQANRAAKALKDDNPDWHVFSATLNSPERY